MNKYKAVVIGGSAGGTKALSRILQDLPEQYRLPIIVVQHIPHGAKVDFSKLFCKTRLNVTVAEEKEPIQAGNVYFAPPGYHLLVELDETLSLSVDEPVNWARPSIDVLFETASWCYGKYLVGIILSGANQDGAAGLKHVKHKGGLALVQAPESADIDVMPRAAIAATKVDHVLALEELSSFLSQL